MEKFSNSMKITIIAVGKVKEKFYRDAIAEYSKRLSRYCKFEIIEVADEKTKEHASNNENELVLEKERDKILTFLKQDAYIIATAIEGRKKDSVNFSKDLNDVCISGKSHIIFLIGGSLGLHCDLKKQANELLSFSDMTFPHQMMRLVLTEQIYRAFRIINNEPYHK